MLPLLTPIEMIVFLAAMLASLYGAYRVADRIARTIRRGQGKIDWDQAKKRLTEALFKTITLQPTFKIRLGPSLPAFITPAVLQVLVDNFAIKPISTPDEDLKAILG